jgi:hypothetical protein
MNSASRAFDVRILRASVDDRKWNERTSTGGQGRILKDELGLRFRILVR